MRFLALLSFVLIWLAPAVEAAVLAIDYGGEFTKLSLVKPGVPFDVVLDKDSKRKIQSVVGWKRDDRVFGQEAKMAATRFPDTHFPYIKPLVGISSPPTLPLYPSPPSISDGYLVFPHPSPPSHFSPAPSDPASTWTPTALLAHQISYFRHLAEGLSGAEPVHQVIVTVPAWWNQFQRRAYREALELQGLTCLAMIGEGTGVALNYAMTRTFPDFDIETGTGSKEYHLIYDSGALSTTATVVAFYQTSVLATPKSKTPVNTTYIEVLGTGWTEIGGAALDIALAEVLKEDFIQKTKESGVSGDKRAMAKLAREANRVKHILSANQESSVNIESLHNDKDYRSRFSRADLEAALADASAHFASPIASAIAASNLTVSDLSSVILFGGNTRVPLVQAAIKSVLPDGDDRIAQNVNTDEAAVFGAAYYGAGLSRQFKMKKIELVERSVYPLTMKGEPIFPIGTRLGERKAIQLPAADTTLEFEQDGKPILSVAFVDVKQALANFTSAEPILNVTLRLDNKGLLSVANAVVVSGAPEHKEGGIAGAISGLFGGRNKEKEEDTEDAESDAPADAETTVKSKDKKDVRGDKVVIKFRETPLGVKTLSGEEKRNIKARLSSIVSYESSKVSREEARNGLEGYLYRLSNLLSPDADNKALWDFSTEKERDGLNKLVASTFHWLSDHAESADEKTLRANRAGLEKLEAPVITRFSEANTRPKAIEDFQQAMFAARAFLVEATKNNTAAKDAEAAATPETPVAPPKYSDAELKEVEELMKDNEAWMDGLMTKQVKITDLWRDPVIWTKDLEDRGRKLQSTCLRLSTRKAPKAPRPVKASSSSSAAPAGQTDEAEREAEPSPVQEAPDAEPPAEPTESSPPIHEEL